MQTGSREYDEKARRRSPYEEKPEGDTQHDERAARVNRGPAPTTPDEGSRPRMFSTALSGSAFGLVIEPSMLVPVATVCTAADAAPAGMIALLASAALLSHFLPSGDHEAGLVTRILLLLAECCHAAIALATKRLDDASEPSNDASNETEENDWARRTERYLPFKARSILRELHIGPIRRSMKYRAFALPRRDGFRPSSR